MKVGSLFTGIGGFDLGLEQAGHEIAWQVESDPFARRVLAARWPHLTCATDVREWPRDGDESVDLGTPADSHAARQQQPKRVDLLCGGFPCQDLSVVGKRGGLAGANSGLFHQFIRIAQALAPTWGLVENVPGLFSSHAGRDMATVLEGLRQCWPVVGYRVLDSRYWGVAQRRRRIFFVGGPTERGVEEILFESEGSNGHLAPRDEAGADVAASLRSRSHRPGINPPGRGGEDDMNLWCAPLTGKPYGDQLGDESKLVCQALTNLASGGADDNDAQAGHLIPFDTTQITSRENRSRPEAGDPCHPLSASAHAPAIAELVPISEVGAKTQMGGGRNGCGIGEEGDPMFTLQAGKQHGVGIRRLTPTECERLQGFPDGWTCLCQSLETYDANVCKCPDGPRYKTLGNAVTVPVIRWIGKHLMRQVEVPHGE